MMFEFDMDMVQGPQGRHTWHVLISEDTFGT